LNTIIEIYLLLVLLLFLVVDDKLLLSIVSNYYSIHLIYTMSDKEQTDQQKDRQKRDRSIEMEEDEDMRKKARAEKVRKDDSQPPTNNPPSSAVIPSTSDSLQMDTNQLLPVLQTNNIDQILPTYKINQTKMIKVEHHIDFLKQSLKEYKIPVGLQWNSEYNVIDETEDFRINIRQIQMHAEIEIVEAIIEHYEETFQILRNKSEAFIKKIEELQTKNQDPDLHRKTKEIDKPIQELRDNLKEKRKKKIAKLETHIKRSETIAKTSKRPKRRPPLSQQTPRQQNYQHLNYQQQNNHRLPHSQIQSQSRQPPPQIRQPPQQIPPRQPLLKTPMTYATVTNLNNRTTYLPRNPAEDVRTVNHNTVLDRDSITELVTTVVQKLFSQMLPSYLQQPYPTMNYHF